MGCPDRYIYAQNEVPWEAQTGLLDSKCSAMRGQDRYVKAQNVVPLEAHTGMLRLKM